MALRKRKIKKELPAPEINITSLMDVLTTLIFFIIMMANFNQFMVLNANPLQTGKNSETDKKPVFTLKVAIIDDRTAKLWLGPIAQLPMVNPEQNVKYLKSRFSGSVQTGFNRIIKEPSSEKLLSTLQDVLSYIKKAFPHETKAVVAFTDRIEYQLTIDVIAAVRSLSEDKTALEVVNLLGKKENTKVLFPEIIVAEWSEGA